MSAGFDISLSSLRVLMRAAPTLGPEDSIGRFVRLCRQYACSSLPVLSGNQLVGIVRETDVLPLLARQTSAEVEAVLHCPLTDVMQPADIIIHPSMSPEEVRLLFTRHHLDLMNSLPVADATGYCLGMVVYSDLFATEGAVQRPGSIGGMATPFGVYLTDGTVQAGAGNLALMTSGMVTGCLLLVAINVIDYGFQWIQHFVTLPHGADLLDVSDIDTRLSPAVCILAFTLKLLMYLIFFGLLRATAIAGYHAAEHQTVHAIERNEPLVAEIVRRMPRPHPRCGTNIMAIGMLLFTLCPLLVNLLHLDVKLALILSAIITRQTWQRFGTFLQAIFTTRPATDKQIASGIAAGHALLGKYYTSMPIRPTLWRRIWCMGLLQNLAGMTLIFGVFSLLELAVTHFSRH